MARTLVKRGTAVTARVCGEAPATPPEQPQGLAGVCEVGVGGLFGRTDQSMRLILIQLSAPRVQPAACNRDSNRAADVGCHDPPRAVRMPRSLS
jgi:hypothetical protein